MRRQAITLALLVLSGLAPVALAPVALAQDPSAAAPRLEGNEIKMPGEIEFENGKATIREAGASGNVLKTVAKVMKDNPSITKLGVEGHTDNTGNAEANKKLSQQRAEAVAKWLEKNGVTKDRLAMSGFGADKPVAPNDTPANKQKNRRTAFQVLEINGKAPGSAPIVLAGVAAAAEPPPPPRPASTGPAVPIPEKQMDGATYAVRLRDLEARVDELKDQIRRSHTRLALLSDTILSGGAAGTRSEVIYRNQMSSAFRLVKVLFVIDGTVQLNKADDTGLLADQKEMSIFNGSIPPGDHTVQVVLNFQGNGYGVFTYLRGYKFEVKSAHSFTTAEGKTLVLTATSLEKGGVTTPIEQRPTIEWNEKFAPLNAGPSTGGGGGGGGVTTTPAPAGSVGGGFSIGGGK